MSAARLADVAARAGVSTITVSRALRAPEKLSPETAAKVAAAMRDLGYVPNLVAGALASARSRAIAVLVPTIGNSIFADTVEGLSAEFEAHGYAIFLAQSGYDADREERTLLALLARRPEALLIVGSPMTEPSAVLLRRAGIPVVEMWELPESPIDAAVGFDNRAAGAVVAEHLIASGRRRLAFVGGYDQRGALRWEGYREAAKRKGLAAHRLIVATPANADAAAASIPVLAKFDAVFASTDVYALGLLTGLRAAGRKVPEDMAVVGLGDLEIARHSVPGLTSVAIDGREIGRQAARLVLSPQQPRRIDLGFKLVHRASG